MARKKREAVKAVSQLEGTNVAVFASSEEDERAVDERDAVDPILIETGEVDVCIFDNRQPGVRASAEIQPKPNQETNEAQLPESATREASPKQQSYAEAHSTMDQVMPSNRVIETVNIVD